MSNKIIALDCDGVLLDWHGGFINWVEQEYGWKLDPESNLDTYDKIVFDDVRNNAILMAILVYMAGEEPETFQKERREMPVSKSTGEPVRWPQVRSPNRSGGKD